MCECFFAIVLKLFNVLMLLLLSLFVKVSNKLKSKLNAVAIIIRKNRQQIKENKRIPVQ